MKRIRREKVINYIESVVLLQNVLKILPLIFIFAMLLLYLLSPTRTYSTAERRYLAQRPTFHIESWLNGKYQVQVETYFSDQFPFRDFWLNVYKGMR